MGLDITAISDLIVKPVPEKYRANIIQNEPINIQNLMSKIDKSCKPEDKQGILALSIISNGAEHNFLDPEFNKDGKAKFLNVAPEIEVTDEAQNWQMNEKDLYYVDWETNRAYYRTESSKTHTVYRSYSGMSDFCRTVNEITGDKMFFPCEGVLDSTICYRYYNILINAWKEWKNKYAPDADLDDDINKIESIDKEHDAYNYYNLFTVLKYAQNCGFARCY
jgi:hypothetical protein